MPPNECPTREELQALSTGRLDPEAIDHVASHLDTCVACQETLETLRARFGALVGTAPASAACDNFVDEPEFRRGIARLHALVDSLQSDRQSGENIGSPSGNTLHEANTVAPAGLSDEARDDQATAADVPAEFGRYRILECLGKGGMGVVYLAYDPQLDRKVALKIPQLAAGAGPEAVERFYRECRAAAKLDHPHICPVYDVGEVDGSQYLVMAYIQGNRLSATHRAGELRSSADAAALVQKIALALEEAHQHGVVHRDLKPANIMINQRGEPIVTDFGLAQLTQVNSREDERLTRTGVALGTPAYMPPEQVTGNIEEMGPACDIYSLGVILYELLVGRLPFQGSITAILGQILVEEPPRPSAIQPKVDREIEAICLKAMAKRPDERFQSMGEFATALGAYLGRADLSAEGGNRARIARRQSDAPRVLPRTFRIAAAFLLAGAVLSGFVVYRIATDAGTLVVQIDENARDIEARLNRDGIMISDTATGQTYKITSAPSRRLPTGRYKVRNPHGFRLVNADGLDVTFTEFAITRNGRTALRVMAQSRGDGDAGTESTLTEAPPAAPASSKRLPAETADRRLAEWVITMGGTVYVVHRDRGIHIRQLKDLPKDRFHVRNVELPNKLAVDDAGLSNLNGTRIQLLNLVGTGITDEGLQVLRKQPELVDLWLGDTQVGDGGLQNLEFLPNLGRLFLFGTHISDNGLAHLKTLPSLRSLSVHRTAITDQGLQSICELKKLDTLAIGQTLVTDAGLAALEGLPNLRMLSLEGSAVGAEGLRNLDKIRHLRELVLHGAAIDERDLVHLPVRLKVLGLVNTQLSDEGLKHLERLSELELLGIAGTRVTEAGIERLQKKLPKLKIQR